MTDLFDSDDLRALRYAEHFCVWALRTSVACSAQCRTLRQEFQRAFGSDDAAATDAYYDLLVRLGEGKRKVRIGRPGHIQLTADELTMARMLAAAQAGDVERFRAHACWIMGHNRLDALYASAVRFTGLLRERGHTFRPLTHVAAPEAVPVAAGMAQAPGRQAK